jgi:hypothetical protein
MASIFDGDWRSLIITNGNPGDDPAFHIEVDPTNNKLEPKSKHGEKFIRGQVGRGVFDHIIIREDDPKAVYKGILLVSGATSIISGLRNLNPQILFDLEREGNLTEKELRNLFQQEQEVWIATKP